MRFKAVLETRGRYTGNTHRVWLLAVKYEEKLYFSRRNTNSDWLKNAQNRKSSKVSFYHGSRLSHQFPKLVKGKGTNDHIVMEFKNSKN